MSIYPTYFDLIPPEVTEQILSFVPDDAEKLKPAFPHFEDIFAVLYIDRPLAELDSETLSAYTIQVYKKAGDTAIGTETAKSWRRLGDLAYAKLQELVKKINDCIFSLSDQELAEELSIHRQNEPELTADELRVQLAKLAGHPLIRVDAFLNTTPVEDEDSSAESDRKSYPESSDDDMYLVRHGGRDDLANSSDDDMYPGHDSESSSESE